MTANAFAELDAARNEFRELVETISRCAPWLGAVQTELRNMLGYSDYEVETPVVYNSDLDSIRVSDDPEFILVADNPGKKEQLAMNRRYLVGQSGKLAAGWFERELGMDFRAVAVIINKTPVHTPKTAELRPLLTLAGPRREELLSLLADSQRGMARIAYRMHAATGKTLWISGYGELGPKGLFRPWAEEIAGLYAKAPRALKAKVWVFRHFSMNQFAVEYKRSEAGGSVAERLARIGKANRIRVLGF